MFWYDYLFFTVLIVFFIKVIISLTVADTDIDLNSDGEFDTDLTSLFSFKGLLHFLFGFSLMLFMIAHQNSGFTDVLLYHFSVLEYVLSIVVGIVCAILLFFIYKFIFKQLTNIPKSPNELIYEKVNTGKLYLKLDNGNYIVSIKTVSGTINREVTPLNNDIEYSIGDIVDVFSKDKVLYFDISV